MRVINAGSGREFEAWFETTAGVPTIPGSGHWRLLCRSTDTVLQDWTQGNIEVVSDGGAITGVKMTVEIPGRLNAIQDSCNKREIKEFQVVADQGSDHEYSEEPVQYYVRNTSVYR